MSRKEKVFIPALEGKKIPTLTLDNKWHQLFTQTESNSTIKVLENELNELIRRQGKLTTEIKDIKKIKAKLMDEIVTLMEETDKKTDKKLEDNKRLINECNEKIEAYQDELMELPREISKVNYELMLVTMEICYDRMKENEKESEQIGNWIKEVRIQLKKNLIRKQEMEIFNHELYSYMHDIFGAAVIEIFDMKYEPEKYKKASDKRDADVANNQQGINAKDANRQDGNVRVANRQDVNTGVANKQDANMQDLNTQDTNKPDVNTEGTNTQDINDRDVSPEGTSKQNTDTDAANEQG